MRAERLTIQIVLCVLHLLASVMASTMRPTLAQSDGQPVRLGGACMHHSDCQHIAHAHCTDAGTCQCDPEWPVVSGEVCLQVSAVNGTCSVEAQCRPRVTHATCQHGRCTCQNKYSVHTFIDGITSCISVGNMTHVPVDPVMIGVLASLILMFIIICVVLRLFSRARFHQNQTIMNTANSRLANASIFRAPVIKPAVEQIRGVTRVNSQSGSVSSARHADSHAVQTAIEQADQRRASNAPVRRQSVDPTQILVQVDTHC